MLAATGTIARTEHLNARTPVGPAITGGAVDARDLRRIHAPQVAGNIVIEIGIGSSYMRLIDVLALKTFAQFNISALGLMGSIWAAVPIYVKELAHAGL